LVGKYLGKGEIKNAKRVITGFTYYFALMCILEAILMISCKNLITDVFTPDEVIRTIGHRVFWSFMVANLLDFWCTGLGGIIRGLGKQNLLTNITFVSYFIIMFPLCYHLSFNVGSHSSKYDKVNISPVDGQIRGLG